MRIIELDGSRMDSVANTHRYLQTDTELPAYEGEDLKAMKDMLAEISENTFIFVQNSQAMEAALGEYASRLIGLWRESERENRYLCFFMR